jgi:hypothetical protein
MVDEGKDDVAIPHTLGHAKSSITADRTSGASRWPSSARPTAAADRYGDLVEQGDRRRRRAPTAELRLVRDAAATNAAH